MIYTVGPRLTEMNMQLLSFIPENECSLLFVELMMEHLKVRREAQETKRQPEEAKQEAETGSGKTTEDTTELTPQPDSREHKDGEHKEDVSSPGKGN